MKARPVNRFGAAAKAVLLLLAVLLFLLFPARYAESVKAGISLWAVSVLPATLPFLFFMSLLCDLPLFRKVSSALSPLSEKLFCVSGEGALAGLISAFSGYPVGARTASDLAVKGRLEQGELFRTACLATTTGPAFLVGAVGCGMFARPEAGWLLLLSHYFGVYSVCFLLRLIKRPQIRRRPPSGTAPMTLGEALSSSVLSVLTVGGAIAIFTAIGQMISDMGAIFSLPPFFETAVRGLLEMTSGCAILARTPSPRSMALCAFFVTFGGLCVLVQQLAFLTRVPFSAPLFVLVKLAQGAVAAGAAYGLTLLFGLY